MDEVWPPGAGGNLAEKSGSDKKGWKMQNCIFVFFLLTNN